MQMVYQSYITFKVFENIDKLRCGFSTRNGGVSTGSFTSMNLGNFLNDNPQNIKINRIRFYKQTGVPEEQMAIPDQIHSARVILANSPGIFPQTDGLITRTAGLFLAIQTADCFPVFFAVPKHKTVALIHAGWRGVADGILTNTLSYLIRDLSFSAGDMFCAIGPGLQKECFEVHADVFEKFEKKYHLPHPDQAKRFIDLSTHIYDQLLAAGIPDKQIENSTECTHCMSDTYFSYRRDGAKSGRMMGIIGFDA